MLTIKQHGHWQRYRPDPIPEKFRLTSSVMFCRREEDGLDWYEFLYEKKVLARDSIKMTVMHMLDTWVVQAVYGDATMLFPQSALLLEIEGITEANPQEAYGQRVFNPDTNEFGGRFAPPSRPLPFVQDLLDRIATLEAKLKG